MPTVERSIVINRPVEEVFDFVADGRNEPQYNPDSLRAELLADAGPGPGARYRSEGRMLGRRMVVVHELTAYERPSHLGLRLLQPPPLMDLVGTQDFAAALGGTALVWRYEVTPRGVGKVFGPLLARMFGQRLDLVLARLKQRLEDTPPSDAPTER